MQITEQVLADYIERGLIKKGSNGDYDIYCYSKETFFEKEWDDVTRAARGLLFYKGNCVNHPFPKIFNLDEVSDVSFDRVHALIKEGEHYELFHKVNGHLTIVDYVPETKMFVVHTKGSIQYNEMNTIDKDIFYHNCSGLINKIKEFESNSKRKTRYTFMFESLTASDKHTLYDHEVEKYGEETLVLLGGYFKLEGQSEWTTLKTTSLEQWADLAGVPLAKQYDVNLSSEDTMKSLFKHQKTEGYVIWFPNIDLRVKIKTDEYWKMRFMKELTADAIIERFVSAGTERVYNRYPEEIADVAVQLLTSSFMDYVREVIDIIEVPFEDMTRKDIATNKVLSKMEKSLIFAYLDGSINNVERLMTNKELRKSFQAYMNDNEALKESIATSLIKFIEERA